MSSAEGDIANVDNTNIQYLVLGYMSDIQHYVVFFALIIK